MALAKYYEDVLERRLELLDGIQFDFSQNNSQDDLKLLKEKLGKEIEVIKLLIEECLDIITNPEYTDIVAMDSQIQQLKKENLDLQNKVLKMKNDFENVKIASKLKEQDFDMVRLNQEISKRDKEISELNYHLKVAHGKSNKYLNKISALRKENMQLKRRVANIQEVFNKQNEKSTSSNSKLDYDISNLESEIFALRKQMALMDKQKNELCDEIKIYKNKIRNLLEEEKASPSERDKTTTKVRSSKKNKTIKGYPMPKPMASTTKKSKSIASSVSKNNELKDSSNNESQSIKKSSSEEQYFAYLAKFKKID